MRSPLSSPFSPGSDTVPQVWAGRTEQLDDWRSVLAPRRRAGIAERGRTVIGEAGSGKSALVRRIAEDAEAQGAWATAQIRIPLGADPLKRTASELLVLADSAGLAASRERRVGELMQRVESVAVSGISLTLRGGESAEPSRALTELLVEIGRSASRDPGRMVLIHLDEMQNVVDDAARSQLLIALGDALVHEEPAQAPGGVAFKKALPIAVYLTGLPEFAEVAGARSGATFARRFQTATLDAIDDAALMAALSPFVTQGWPVLGTEGEPERIFMEPAAQSLIVELSCGEPFLFQLAGERAWLAGEGDVISADDVKRGWTRAAPEAEVHVARTLDRLPGRERAFLEAMAELDEEDRTLTAIAHRMGYARASDAGPASQRLDLVRGIIERGRSYRFRNRAVGAYLAGDWPRPGARA